MQNQAFSDPFWTLRSTLWGLITPARCRRPEQEWKICVCVFYTSCSTCSLNSRFKWQSAARGNVCCDGSAAGQNINHGCIKGFSLKERWESKRVGVNRLVHTKCALIVEIDVWIRLQERFLTYIFYNLISLLILSFIAHTRTESRIIHSKCDDITSNKGCDSCVCRCKE